MKMKSLFTALMLTLALGAPQIADAGFGGSRGGFSGSRSSSFGGSRSSSFGGSRSSSFGGSRSSSFGGSRSAPSRPSYSPPSKSSSFGGSRSTAQPAPIVRPSQNSYGTNRGYSTGTVTNNYHSYGGGSYGGGSGFYHGMMLGYLWNRPQTVYVGGQNVVVGSNGQPLYENGQPVVYENTHPFLTFLGTLVMLSVLGLLIYALYSYFKRNEA